MAEEEEDFFDSLLENDRSCGRAPRMLTDLAALNATVEIIMFVAIGLCLSRNTQTQLPIDVT